MTQEERVYELCIPYYLADNSLGLFRRTMKELKKQKKDIKYMQDDEIKFIIKQVLKSAYS